MKKYNVWVPTGEMLCYEIEAESPQEARKKLINAEEWPEPVGYSCADMSSSDFEIEEAE